MEDENQTNDTSEETVERKDNTNFTVWEGVIRRSQLFSVCDQLVHAICGSYSEDSEEVGLKVACNLCVRKNRINNEWEGAKSGQEQQAQKIVSLSYSRLPAVDIGTKVVVRVPDLDRGRLVTKNVLAVVDVNSSGLYLLGVKEGLLERLYARNELTAADNFIEAHDVPSSSLSLPSAWMITSGSKQGFVSCHCKRYCTDKNCKCRPKNMRCNSKFRPNSSCKNKWASPLFSVSPTLHVFLINKLLNLQTVHLHDISRCGSFCNATTRCGRFFRSLSVFDLWA
jgi:hypothetical protein